MTHDGARSQPGPSEGHENSQYQAKKSDCKHLSHRVNTGSGLAGQVVPASYPSHAAKVPRAVTYSHHYHPSTTAVPAPGQGEEEVPQTDRNTVSQASKVGVRTKVGWDSSNIKATMTG